MQLAVTVLFDVFVFRDSIAAIGPGIRLQDVQKGGGLTSLQKKFDQDFW